MRIDSCRKCGIEMTIKQKCSTCHDPIKFNCKKCHFESEEQIHSLCKMINVNHRPLIPKPA